MKGIANRQKKMVKPRASSEKYLVQARKTQSAAATFMRPKKKKR